MTGGDPRALGTGEVLGGYRLERLLGSGSTSKVYLGTHVLLGRTAAVKVLVPELIAHQDVVRRLLDEARVVNDVRHPNIVDIFDFVVTESPPRVALVMEHIKGPSLKALRDSPLARPQALGVALQLVDAVAAAHAAGVIHRDLKPDNLLLTDQPSGDPCVVPTLKIVDFGVAKLAGRGARTATGMLLGPPAYMAPEQVAGRPPPSPATDVFAIGEVLFELLTGQRAYPANTIHETVRAKLRGELPDLSLPGVMGREILSPLIARCLAHRPEDRPPLPEIRAVVTKLLEEAKREEARAGKGRRVEEERPRSAVLSEPVRTPKAPAIPATPAAPEAPPRPRFSLHRPSPEPTRAAEGLPSREDEAPSLEAEPAPTEQTPMATPGRPAGRAGPRETTAEVALSQTPRGSVVHAATEVAAPMELSGPAPRPSPPAWAATELHIPAEDSSPTNLSAQALTAATRFSFEHGAATTAVTMMDSPELRALLGPAGVGETPLSLPHLELPESSPKGPVTNADALATEGPDRPDAVPFDPQEPSVSDEQITTDAPEDGSDRGRPGLALLEARKEQSDRSRAGQGLPGLGPEEDSGRSREASTTKPPPDRPALRDASAQRPLVSLEAPSDDLLRARSAVKSAVRELPVPSPPPRSRRGLLLGIGALWTVAVALVASIFTLKSQSKAEPPPLAAPATGANAAEPRVAAPLGGKVAVNSVPAGARVEDADTREHLGDTPVDLPFTSSAKLRRITLSLPGHKSVTLDIPHANTRIWVDLEAE